VGNNMNTTYHSYLAHDHHVYFPHEICKLYLISAIKVKTMLRGHCHLKSYLFKVNLIDSPICGRWHKETASDIFCECAALAE
jgi:hypothetical protein